MREVGKEGMAGSTRQDSEKGMGGRGEGWKAWRGKGVAAWLKGRSCRDTTKMGRHRKAKHTPAVKSYHALLCTGTYKGKS